MAMAVVKVKCPRNKAITFHHITYVWNVMHLDCCYCTVCSEHSNTFRTTGSKHKPTQPSLTQATCLAWKIKQCTDFINRGAEEAIQTTRSTNILHRNLFKCVPCFKCGLPQAFKWASERNWIQGRAPDTNKPSLGSLWVMRCYTAALTQLGALLSTTAHTHNSCCLTRTALSAKQHSAYTTISALHVVSQWGRDSLQRVRSALKHETTIPASRWSSSSTDMTSGPQSDEKAGQAFVRLLQPGSPRTLWKSTTWTLFPTVWCCFCFYSLYDTWTL